MSDAKANADFDRDYVSANRTYYDKVAWDDIVSDWVEVAEKPMTCVDCGAPAFYDNDMDQFHHAVRVEPGTCWSMTMGKDVPDANHPLLRPGHDDALD